MRPVLLYIAASLDGYIARPDGSVDWLESFPNPDGSDFGYADFFATIDTTLMGRNTYQEILGFGEPFPYPNTVNYVFTRQKNLQSTDYVTIIHENPIEFVKNLKQQAGGNIWLVGGGQLNTLLLNADLIDEIWLTLLPIVLGEGIPLWAPTLAEKRFALAAHRAFSNGFIQFHYKK